MTVTPLVMPARVGTPRPSFVLAEVKSVATDSGSGEFELVMSTDSVDRDGEQIVKGAFDPLPASIPVHAFHDFHDPVGRVVPEYDGEGRLVGRGFFASTPRAQEIRQLVTDGVIGHSSVGFMAAQRSKAADGDGPPQVTSAELLEVSFVSVPSNRDAAVLMVKELDAAVKAGARNSAKDSERLQSIHDYAVENGAVCPGVDPGKSAAPDEGAPLDVTTTAPETPPDEGGKSPASAVVEWARNRAVSALLTAPR